MDTDKTTINTYRVTITSDLLGGPLVMDLIATTPERAKTRAGMTAMHMYRCAELLDAPTTVEYLHAGPPTDED